MGLDTQLEWIEWVDDVMPGRYDQRILDLKKMGSWSLTVDASGWVFKIWSDQISLGLDWQRWIEIWDATKCSTRGGWECQRSMPSIGFYELSLSPHVTKNWRPNKINLFVWKTTESSCIIIIIEIIMAILYIYISISIYIYIW